MVTTRSSERYTPFALRSFFESTQLGERDRFVLIGNDTDYTVPDDLRAKGVEFVRNPTPKGFAENMNVALRECSQSRHDAVLLNNDVIFTPGWFQPVAKDDTAILSPLSSREVRYEYGSLTCTNPMELDDFIGHEDALNTIAREHAARSQGYMGVLVVPFFASRIPLPIIDAVGLLDETFGKGGGEDYDYCLRAIEAGFTISFAIASYVLHFGGKSSWSGAESRSEQDSRERIFMGRFEEKWGPTLSDIILREKIHLIDETPGMSELITAGKMREVVAHFKGR